MFAAALLVRGLHVARRRRRGCLCLFVLDAKIGGFRTLPFFALTRLFVDPLVGGLCAFQGRVSVDQHLPVAEHLSVWPERGDNVGRGAPGGAVEGGGRRRQVDVAAGGDGLDWRWLGGLVLPLLLCGPPGRLLYHLQLPVDGLLPDK